MLELKTFSVLSMYSKCYLGDEFNLDINVSLGLNDIETNNEDDHIIDTGVIETVVTQDNGEDLEIKFASVFDVSYTKDDIAEETRAKQFILVLAPELQRVLNSITSALSIGEITVDFNALAESFIS